ncbi:hypothetical protein [uncultured Cohaesibacter sp.]|uniref:hypothetical protein n=1 Tax=uncultured Cohaesibacter sp. TaxID=1002546 RepID=UPI0029C7F62A|nr:hypothetical protein [uncultured Cohaesibacter sp.]
MFERRNRPAALGHKTHVDIGSNETGLVSRLGQNAPLDELAAGSREVAEATLTVRQELGNAAEQVDHDQLLLPLTAGLRYAAARNGRKAVLQAGIAVENFLTHTAAHHGTNIAGTNGINAKMDCLKMMGTIRPNY